MTILHNIVSVAFGSCGFGNSAFIFRPEIPRSMLEPDIFQFPDRRGAFMAFREKDGGSRFFHISGFTAEEVPSCDPGGIQIPGKEIVGVVCGIGDLENIAYPGKYRRPGGTLKGFACTPDSRIVSRRRAVYKNLPAEYCPTRR